MIFREVFAICTFKAHSMLKYVCPAHHHLHSKMTCPTQRSCS